MGRGDRSADYKNSIAAVKTSCKVLSTLELVGGGMDAHQLSP